MFRQSFRRLGHQLIREPMPNVEHDTAARGRATFGSVMDTIKFEAMVAGAGVALASYCVFSAYTTPVTIIRSNGKIETK